MIKWIFSLITWVLAGVSYAGEPYSKTQCDQIKKERAFIRSQFRNGYNARQGDRLNARDKVLFSQFANHCSNPKKAGSSYRAVGSRAADPSWLLNQKVSGMSLYSDSYSDQAKLDAWSKFYALPTRCRKKEMKSSDFVWCSEYRGKQKELFEAQWQRRP